MYETFQPPDFNTPLRLGAGAAPHGRRQERRLCLHRQLLRRHARQDQHPHQGDDAHSAAESGSASALSGRGRQGTTTSGPTCGAPTRSPSTTRPPASGRCSSCRRAAPSRATSRCSSATASRCRWSSPIRAAARSRVMTPRTEADIAALKAQVGALTFSAATWLASAITRPLTAASIGPPASPSPERVTPT